MQNEQKTCQNCKLQFVIEPEDFLFYDKIKVPPPTWCPECRMIRRFVFRNHRNLFRRKDDASGKEIFSSFPEQAPVKVYEREYWWSDQWDPMIYDREYDFSKSFFEQFQKLLYSVPLFSKSVQSMVNSEYCDQAGWVKNSYLCFDAGEIENSAYLVSCYNIKDSFDLYESRQNELCCNSLQVDGCYRAFFSFDCESCTDVWFSKDLVGCANCFGCVNLRKKSYHIFNQPYSKEEYFEKLKRFNLGSYQSVRGSVQDTHKFWLKFPVKYMHGYRNTNGSSGEHVQDTKNVKESYCIHGGENIKYSQLLDDRVTDSYDYTNFGIESSLVYESVTSGFQSYALRFCWECWQESRDLEYSAYCISSSNLFGCVGLRKKEYCILNKQYTKDTYFTLRDAIIKHMNEAPYIDKQGRVYRYGEFFPSEFSPFAYNETLAHDFFPLTKEKAAAAGYVWREPEAKEFQTTFTAVDLPDSIKEVSDSILKEVIRCASCAKEYRVIPMELDFLRRMDLPIPRLCPNCRFLERFTLVNPPKFWHGKCQCAGIADDRGIYKNAVSHFHGVSHCPNEFETSYAPERPEIVFCEQCYNSEIA